MHGELGQYSNIRYTHAVSVHATIKKMGRRVGHRGIFYPPQSRFYLQVQDEWGLSPLMYVYGGLPHL
jgi:hypothetical protein